MHKNKYVNDVNKTQYPLITQTIIYNVEMMNLNLTNDKLANSGNYKIKDREDNWQQFDYIKHRWVDAVGAVFNTQFPCSSVSYSDGTFNISYNTYPNLMTSRLVSEIFDHFKNNNIKDLLPYYLLFNYDFHGEIKHYAKANKSIDELYKALLSLAKPLKNFYETNNDQYSNNCLKLINSSMKSIFDNNYLKINFEANIDELRYISNSVTNSLKSNEAANKVNTIQNLKNIIFNFSNKIYQFIIDEIIKEDTNDISLKETTIRPLQDVYKLNYVLNQINNTNSVLLEYKILPNPHNIHTEVNNLMYIFPFESQEQIYMGIPKLCCALCDIVLTKANVLHRGTHGIYDKWETSGAGSLANIKKIVDKKCKDGEYKQVEPKAMPILTRSLSTDSFEQNMEEFWKIKTKLGLTQELGDNVQESINSVININNNLDNIDLENANIKNIKQELSEDEIIIQQAELQLKNGKNYETIWKFINSKCGDTWPPEISKWFNKWFNNKEFMTTEDTGELPNDPYSISEITPSTIPIEEEIIPLGDQDQED